MSGVKTVSVATQMGESAQVVATIRGHKITVDQPKAGGGEDTGPTPLELLHCSLGACICSIARIVARQKKINLREIEVTSSGELDTHFLLGKETDARCGFGSFRIEARIDADLSPEQKREFIEEVEKRCPVSDNLKEVTPITLELLE